MISTISEAKAHLAELLERALAGEEIIIGEDGKPIARLVPYPDGELPPRKGGQLKGKIWIADDFDAPLPDHLLRYFQGLEP